MTDPASPDTRSLPAARRASVLPALLPALLPLALLAGPAMGSEWSYSGDARGGVFSTERDARNGSESDLTDVRLRLRFALERDLAPGWHFRARLAGRYGDEQDGSRVYLRGYAPTATGTELGDTTVDEFYVEYAPDGADWSLRAGRLQTKFELMGVAAKSLDRNDSPSTDVSWTDGLHWRYRGLPGWQGHVILQHNHRLGPGTTARPPLEFSEDGSRVAVFAGLEATEPSGPLVQRMVAVTWLPDALATFGEASGAREDYVAVTAKLAAAWPAGSGDRRWLFAGEIGHAPNTPRGSVVGTGASGSAGGTAWQASANLQDFAPGHHIGLVFGRADAGWLLSPDFRNNDRLAELRYQWKISSTLSMEARVRRREELDVPESALQPRVDRDVYARLTMKF